VPRQVARRPLICGQVPPNAAVGRWSRDIRGMTIGAFPQVVGWIRLAQP